MNPHDGDSHEESERKKRDEREALLGEQERELEAVKRAEEAERFGAGGRGRDVGIGGVSAARGANGVAMNEGSEVRTAIAGIRDAEGGLVVLVSSFIFLSSWVGKRSFMGRPKTPEHKCGASRMADLEIAIDIMLIY